MVKEGQQMQAVENTVIVGAGPYGLSLAAHLQAAGRPFVLLGTPLESWREHMPDGMVLKSEPFASNLWDPERRFTLEKFCQERRIPYQPARQPLSLARFLDYAEWFRQSAVGESRDVKANCIRRTAAGFSLDLSNRSSLEARQIVLATGHMPFRFIPPELAGLPEPLCIHSSAIRDVKRYAGRDVTVVGAGQSALESAALLHEAGAKVRLIVRKSQVLWNGQPVARSLLARVIAPESGLANGWKALAIAELPRVFRAVFPAAKRHRFVAASFGPAGAWWLRERVERQIELHLNHRIRAAANEGGQVRLHIAGPDGERQIVTDHVVAGTGFQVNVDRLGYIDAKLRAEIAREGDAPMLSAGFQTSVPGLYIIGIASAPVFGPVMRFMFGAKHAAPIVARQLR
jgi:cation diffusion facilitator CzcD-associated flavoprotein CzcO